MNFSDMVDQPSSAAYLISGCEVALRATLILGVVALVTRGMSRTSAAARHWLWSIGIIGVLLLPLLSAVTPVSIPLYRAVPRPVQFILPPPEAEAFPENASLERPESPPTAVPFDVELEARRMLQSPEDEIIGEIKPATSRRPVLTVMERVRSTSWPAVVIAVWLAGAVLFSLPLLAGGLSLYWLQRRSQPLAVHIAEELNELVCQHLDGREVLGLQSASRVMPMTWGVYQPVLLLPAEATTWSAERRRLVLLHELAHIRRHDCLLQMIGQFVRAMHWFNPLAWWALRQLRLEQEQACDDAVLNAGTDADEYAAELLVVSSRLPQSSWTNLGSELGGGESAVALAMSRVTRLELRIRAILNMNNNRRPLSMRAVTWSLALSCGFVGAVASVQRHAAQAAPPASERKPASVEIELVGPPMPIPLLPAKVASNPPAPSAVVADAAQAPKTEGSGATATPAPQAAVPADGEGQRLLEVLKKIESLSAIETNPTALNEAAIRGMLGSLKDPYSTFISADELKQLHQQIEGQLVGIGAALSRKDDITVVQLVLPNSPAMKVGLKVGDVILAVNGQAVGVLDETIKAVRGPAGTEVWLKIRRDQTESILSFTRDIVRLSTVRGVMVDEKGQWNHWLDMNQKVGYVHLAEFNATTQADLKVTLKSLADQGLKGLVLDLRGNPGGLLNVVLETAQLFLKDVLVLQTRGRTKESDSSHRAGPEAAYPDLPLVVVVDNRTASAAEILTAALKDNSRAIVVGERTFGKGSIQSIIPIEGEYTNGPAVKLTIAQMLSPKGRAWNRTADAKEWGIDPDDGFYVPLTMEQRTARNIQRAARENGTFKRAEPLTPEAVEQQLADPALAAAFKSMLAKVAGGEFVKTGKPLADQQSQFARHDEVRKERDELKKKLEQLERELVP